MHPAVSQITASLGRLEDDSSYLLCAKPIQGYLKSQNLYYTNNA